MITGESNQPITNGQGDDARPSTKERLADAGLRLFAERGFDSVSVGDIEREVGLQPRRGALYRHFASKAELLESAVAARLEAVTAARARFAHLATGGADSAEELAGWILGEMGRQQAITQILERDGDRLGQLRDRFRRDISDAAYAGMAEILSGWLAARGSDRSGPELRADAVLLLGALINVRRSTWTLGDPPLGLGDEELAASWARLARGLTAGGAAP